MTVKLAVAGAFHTGKCNFAAMVDIRFDGMINLDFVIVLTLFCSDFMAPAVSALEEVLDGIELKKPRIPVISNVDAKPHSDPDTIKKLLATQVTSPVLWENTMDLMLSKGFEKAYELGPGKVTAGILKRFDKSAECINVEV